MSWQMTNTEKWQEKKLNEAFRQKYGSRKRKKGKLFLGLRGSKRYYRWCQQVLQRDGWKCQECGKKGGNLQAHHLLSFKNCVEKRFALENGKTVCETCHDIIHAGLIAEIKQQQLG